MVQDIDCMPMNPVDYIPEALRRHFGAGKVSYMAKQLQINEISNFEGGVMCGSGESLENLPSPSSNLVKVGKVRYMKFYNPVFNYNLYVKPFVFHPLKKFLVQRESMYSTYIFFNRFHRLSVIICYGRGLPLN